MVHWVIKLGFHCHRICLTSKDNACHYDRHATLRLAVDAHSGYKARQRTSVAAPERKTSQHVRSPNRSWLGAVCRRCMEHCYPPLQMKGTTTPAGYSCELNWTEHMYVTGVIRKDSSQNCSRNIPLPTWTRPSLRRDSAWRQKAVSWCAVGGRRSWTGGRSCVSMCRRCSNEPVGDLVCWCAVVVRRSWTNGRCCVLMWCRCLKELNQWEMLCVDVP